MSDFFNDSNVNFDLRKNSSHSTNDNIQIRRTEVRNRDVTSAKKVVRSRASKRKKSLKNGMIAWLLIAAVGLASLGYVFKDDIQGYIDQYRIHDTVLNDQDDDVVSNNEQFVEEHEETEEATESTEETTEPDIVVGPVEDYSFRLLNEGYDFQEIDWASLKAINPDIVGYVEIPGTSISYPVVQSSDNQDYLHLSIYGEYSADGTPFADKYSPFSENSFDLTDHTCIYGHHMSGGRVFADLDKYRNASYLSEHPYGVIYTEDGQAYMIEFFSVNIFTGSEGLDELHPGDFENEEAFDNYLDELTSNSVSSNSLDVEYGDNILSLVTCTYDYGDNMRVAVTGKVTKQLVNADLLIASGEEYTISR